MQTFIEGMETKIYHIVKKKQLLSTLWPGDELDLLQSVSSHGI